MTQRRIEYWVIPPQADGASIRYRFFQFSNDNRRLRQWPAGTRYYYIRRYNVRYSTTFSVNGGGNVCYGAATPDGRWCWGLGLDGRQRCSNCCYNVPQVGILRVGDRLSC